MAGRFIVAIDLEHLQDGLDLKTISYLNRVLLNVSYFNHQKCLKFCQENVDHFTIYCDCNSLSDINDIIALLNSGVTQVFISQWQLEVIVQERLLIGHDLSRIIVSFHNFGPQENVEESIRFIPTSVKALVPDVPIGIHFHGDIDLKYPDAVQSMDYNGDIFSDRYVSLGYPYRDQFARTVKSGHVAIVDAKEITKVPEQYSNRLPVHKLVTAALHSDRSDGLFTTIVANERGICLGLVYSNEKSIETALRLGRGVYHSRRHGLWIKGQESGNTQELISIAVDCDADALRFNVRQKGEGSYRATIPSFCTLLTVRRILSSEELDLLWSVRWSLTPPKNLRRAEAVSTCGVIYCSPV